MLPSRREGSLYYSFTQKEGLLLPGFVTSSLFHFLLDAFFAPPPSFLFLVALYVLCVRDLGRVTIVFAYSQKQSKKITHITSRLSLCAFLLSGSVQLKRIHPAVVKIVGIVVSQSSNLYYTINAGGFSGNSGPFAIRV